MRADEETPAKELSEVSPSTSGGSLPDDTTRSHRNRNVENGSDSTQRGRGRALSGQTDEIRESHESDRTISDEGHDAQVATPHRSRSRAQSSTRSLQKEAVVVPRGERRGLFARLAVLAEVTEPHDYSNKKKWMITFVVAVAAAAAPMGSSIILPALGDITIEFNSTPTIVNLSVAMYMLSMSIFPLWWSSFSETLGRRTIYLSSFVLFAYCPKKEC